MIIHSQAFPRAALIGNPSDGYFGKTIAFVFDNFQAEVTLFETPELEIIPQERDRSLYLHLEGLYQDVKLHGYYGGIRLLKATIKRFVEYCKSNRVVLDERNFTVRYSSNIPHRVGLAGSSAIITACMRALMQFYNIQIPKPHLANLILSVETIELGIGAGLQDRVAQVYQHPVYMDFNKDNFDKRGYGKYDKLDHKNFANIYIAYRTDFSEGSEIVHNDLRKRFDKGDEQVHEAMRTFAELTLSAREALTNRNYEMLGKLMDQNFDLRKSITQISKENIEMVSQARKMGASAKFTGSGGAVIGIYQNEDQYITLVNQMEQIGVKVIKPNIVLQS